jgi:Flp pilus assembly pilin Flp
MSFPRASQVTALSIPERDAGVKEGVRLMNLFVMRTWLQARFGRDERGASMVEYILLVALIAIAVIAAVVFLRSQVQSKFSDAGSQLSQNGT